MKTLLRVLTNSERSVFACPRRWWFRYVIGLTTFDNPLPFLFGSLWHQILAAWYRSACTMSTDAIVGTVTAPWFEKRRVFHKTSAFDVDLIEQQDRDTVKMNLGMFEGYRNKWADDAKEWKIILVEHSVARWLKDNGQPVIDYVKVPVRGGGFEMRRRTWSYGGALDLVIQKYSDGTNWLVEHKTTMEVDLVNHMRKLHWDPQIRGYPYALRKPITGEPIRVDGVIYNVARKKLPGVPEPIKNGSRLSIAAIDTTREVFLQAVLRHGFSPDLYADKLEELRNVEFFAREHYPLTDPELEEFERDAVAHARMMITEERAGYHARQVNECTGPMRSCEFASNVCMEDGPQMRKMFNVLGLRHPELEGDLAEPWVLSQRPGASPLSATPMADVPMADPEIAQPAPEEEVPAQLLEEPDDGIKTQDPFSWDNRIPWDVDG